MEPSLGLLGGGGGGTGLPSEQEEKGSFMAGEEAELELGLGLTLGNSGGTRRRILTAKDFPNGFSSGGGGVAGAGTKRERPAGGGGGGGDGVDEGCSSAAVSQVVGWPPIRAYRMNTLFTTQSKASNGEDEKGVGGNENNEKKSKKKINHGNEKSGDAANERSSGRLGLVKVNMDGLPIGRKVDLNAHKSYETLAKTLEEMFFKPSVSIRERPMLLDGSSEFVLTYEDKEGDWMLVGDVPWRMFLNTVKRLRIMRTAEANGLAPKFQERDEKQKGKPI